MRSIRKYLVATTCIYTIFAFVKVFAQSSKNKFYFEPFFKIDYQIWQNEQLESKNDGNYTYKFRGLYYGPRVGLKVIRTYNSYVIYGAEGSTVSLTPMLLTTGQPVRLVQTIVLKPTQQHLNIN